MKEIFGETIDAIYIDKDRKFIVFVGNDRKIYCYQATGGCCSETWIESILHYENMICSRIIGIEEKMEEEVDGIEDERGRCVIIYGYTFKTDRGYSDLEFRNANNGYYGGQLTFIEDASVKVERNDNKETISVKLIAYKNQPNHAIEIFPYKDK